MEFAAGDLVTVRGEPWIVEATTEHADCRVLRLSASRRDVIGDRGPKICELLLPFDRPIKSTSQPTIRVETRRRWMRHLHQLLARRRAAGELLGAATAAIDLLPFQLEPAIALVQGRSSRFLLADEVGLGKTIQAGLMLAELGRRGWCGRALILTPAGLRSQWQRELRDRFDIDSTIIDAASLDQLYSSLPQHINPWSTDGVFLSSIDFVKQPEVRLSVSSELWDLLIVDEAHQVTDGSQRHEAVSQIADRARNVVLLTATPHGGHESAYRALCDLGRIDDADRILIFRRTRRDVAAHRQRRVHLLRVTPHPTERVMHRALELYASRLWRIAESGAKHALRLAAAVLSKRAFSSAASLARSLERRVVTLTSGDQSAIQSSLPFNADDDRQDEAWMPVVRAFDSADEEIAALTRLLDLARAAASHESKLRALIRLLRRTSEPAIVFTEYRDTLNTLAESLRGNWKIALLHGGLSVAERAQAVSAFTSGSADLLLSTDAGAEGLNLHARCRLVVNLELPWNPTRLEQRVGRVDRIGQVRTVHAFNLLAGGTPESEILAALVRRLECIQASEIEVAASIIDRAPLPPRRDGPVGSGDAQTGLSQRARVEATRLASIRTLATAPVEASDAYMRVTSIRRRRGPAAFQTLCVVRVRIGSVAGRLVEDLLLPLALTARVIDVHGTRASVIRQRTAELIRILGPSVMAKAREVGERRAAELERECGGWIREWMRREQHLARALMPVVSARYQAGLFDNRTTKTRREALRRSSLAADECARRAMFLSSEARIQVVAEPHIALVLLSC